MFSRKRRRAGDFFREDTPDFWSSPPAPLTYAINQWKPLSRFLEDGRLAIHNKACERALRKIAVGRANWLFAAGVVRQGNHDAKTKGFVALK